MGLTTASSVISFSKKLETDSAAFYEKLSGKYQEKEDVFLTYVKENQKNIKQTERAYYGVITDAIEGCFAFNITEDDYSFDTELVAEANYAEVIDKALEIEEKIIKFYLDAAEQSRSLMADVPVAFKMAAKKRENRKSTLINLAKGML